MNWNLGWLFWWDRAKATPPSDHVAYVILVPRNVDPQFTPAGRPAAFIPRPTECRFVEFER